MLNFTVYSLSAIAGPVEGGTEVIFDTSDASGKPGVLSYGLPTCLFGDKLPESGVHPLATLHGGQPRLFTAQGIAAQLAWGDAAVPAHVARQRMCAGTNQLDRLQTCTCRVVSTTVCGCGCRQMLPRFSEDLDDLDQCGQRQTFYTNPAGQYLPRFETLCGPTSSAWHRPIAESRAPYASCAAPPRAAGRVAFEYSPSGELAAATSSAKRKLHFTYYETYVDSLAPRSSPTDGGTAVTVNGHNLWTYGVAEIKVNGTVRAYTEEPRCFFVDADETELVCSHVPRAVCAAEGELCFYDATCDAAW